MNSDEILKLREKIRDFGVFGQSEIYNKGDVVVWRGFHPAIIKMTRDVDVSMFTRSIEKVVYINSKYQALSYRNLRPASEDEINLLGDKDVFELGYYPLIE